jgi:ribosomal protein S18 acetylase RimI-like enzyme
MDTFDVTTVTAVDGSLLEAFRRLVPQLSSSAAEISAADLADIISTPATTLIVARSSTADRTIVGILTLVLFRIPTGIRAWIEDVVVDQSAQGRGIGEALSRAAIDLARDRGARTIELTSRPSRQAANALYRKLGFQPRDTNVYRLTL